MNDSYLEGNPLFERDDLEADFIRRQKEGRHKKISFVFGFFTVIFSLIGFFGVIFSAVNFIIERAETKKEEKLAYYNEFLLAVASVDPKPFDDITAADTGELVEVAIWSIIGSDLEPDRYDYSTGELAIPVSDVEFQYNRYFGSQLPIKHQTVTGYGYEFKYNAEDGCYYIPLTAIEPVYTPMVTDSEEKGDTVTLTLGLINSGSWKQDAKTGKISTPDPDKYVKVTLINSGAGSYISALRATNSMESAIVEIFTSAVIEENTSSASLVDESSTAA